MILKSSHPLANSGLNRSCLSGRLAVVTGAGRGIGLESARALAWLGACVIIAEINPDMGRAAEQAICAEGGEAHFIQTDIANADSVASLAQESARWGTVEILINNAILCPAVSVAEMSIDQWDQVLAVNLRGTFLTCRAFLPGMLAQQRGVIVNMVSTEAMPGLAAYIASKQGILGFSQSLALEVGDAGVKVIPFGPGMVDTPGIRAVAPDLAPRLGLDEAQFLQIPLHPAFAGLMPAEYAGAATAYLVAALADEFHGETVTAYTVLERAGMIAPASASDIVLPGQEDEVGPQSTDNTPSSTPETGTGSSQATSSLPGFYDSFVELIQQTEAEFNQLPVFIRPLARNGFKGKSGQSLADWQRTAAALRDQAQALERGEVTTFQQTAARLRPLLPKLIEYYRGVPAETARFTKDAAMLQQVTRISQERIALIEQLLIAIG